MSQGGVRHQPTVIFTFSGCDSVWESPASPTHAHHSPWSSNRILLKFTRNQPLWPTNIRWTENRHLNQKDETANNELPWTKHIFNSGGKKNSLCTDETPVLDSRLGSAGADVRHQHGAFLLGQSNSLNLRDHWKCNVCKDRWCLKQKLTILNSPSKVRNVWVCLARRDQVLFAICHASHQPSSVGHSLSSDTPKCGALTVEITVKSIFTLLEWGIFGGTWDLNISWTNRIATVHSSQNNYKQFENNDI